MITLHRVEIVNIRSLPYAVIEPNLDGGLTALAGGNGMGKSTVQAAVVWALYGVTPDDVTVKGMRRQGSDGQECRVTVVVSDGTDTIEVTRALKGRNDTTVAQVKVNGVEIANVSARTATAWVTNRLGIDAEGFLTAFVVRQKELDDLVKARPAARKKQIERLAGIERMSDAVQRARDTENDARRTYTSLPGDQASLDKAILTLHEITEAIPARRDALTRARTAAADASTVADTADAALQALQQAVADRAAVIDEGSTARAAREGVDSQIAAKTQRRDELAAEARGGDPAALAAAAQAVADATAAVEAAQQAAQDAAEARSAAQNAAEQAAAADTELSRARARLADLTAAAQAAADAVAGIPATLDADLADAQTAAAAAAADLADAQAEFRRLETAIATLTDAHSPQCPTCQQGLDDPDALVASLTRAREQVRADGQALRAAFDAAEKRVQQVTAQTQQRAVLTATNEQAAAAVAAQQADVTARQTAATDAHARADAAAERARVAGATDPQTALKDANARLATAQEAHSVVKQAAAAAARIPALTAEIDRLRAEQADLETTLTALRARVAQIPVVTDEQVTAARATATDARRAATGHAVEVQRLEGDLALLLTQQQTAERDVTVERDKIEAKARVLRTVEESAATRESLEAFRLDRLARIAPEIAEVATDLVAAMTSGRFVAVDLDENFSAVVTGADGVQRPASWLSGGEESCVALALRVGIGEVIAGSRGGILFLDEVLTAQDADRRQAMISAIRALHGRQVIMINHVAEALDIADRGYWFQEGEDGLTEVRDLAVDLDDIAAAVEALDA